MRKLLTATIKFALWAAAYGALGGLVIIVVGFVLYLESCPDLEPWHTEELDAEFTADSRLETLADYLAFEEAVFAQLDHRFHDASAPPEESGVNRYRRGSLSDPGRWQRNWNRTFELATDPPAAGVLLLHGMSDAPYSLRAIAYRLNRAGAHVLGLRMPGHGTVPSGLTGLHWKDMAAVVEVGVRHLRERLDRVPIFIVGYSTGGGLAVNYALDSLRDDGLPAPAGIVLISPSIGVTALAPLAVWQARLGHLLDLDKLEWNELGPEYNPYKYTSFAVNAGDQVYRLTLEIRRKLDELGARGELDRFPPVLAFQSVADATVSAPALVAGLFAKLPPANHELVLFDINRSSGIEHLLAHDPAQDIAKVIRDASSRFNLTVLTNADRHSDELVIRSRRWDTPGVSETPAAMSWPDGHVALCFPQDDPLYGSRGGEDSPGIRLGELALRGERGVLQISAADMLRLKWNPFYPYLERRTLAFMDLGGDQR